MVTDPGRIHKTDPGNPDICVVYTYHKIYTSSEAADIQESCKQGTIGCVACKKKLAQQMDIALAPYRDKREYYAQRPELVKEILHDGKKVAEARAEATMQEVRTAMHL